jgi:hypothetical protein
MEAGDFEPALGRLGKAWLAEEARGYQKVVKRLFLHVPFWGAGQHLPTRRYAVGGWSSKRLRLDNTGTEAESRVRAVGLVIPGKVLANLPGAGQLGVVV